MTEAPLAVRQWVMQCQARGVIFTGLGTRTEIWLPRDVTWTAVDERFFRTHAGAVTFLLMQRHDRWVM
jgi:hypothetical protein